MKLRYKCLICFVVIAALVLPWSLFAGHCVQPVRSYAQSYYRPVYIQQAYSPYLYAVGTDLVLETLAEKLQKKLELKQKESEREKFKSSALATKCASCHKQGSKAVAEEGAPIFFDPAGSLTANAEQRASMRTAAYAGFMPPAKELTDDEYLQLKKELSEAH